MKSQKCACFCQLISINDKMLVIMVSENDKRAVNVSEKSKNFVSPDLC